VENRSNSEIKTTHGLSLYIETAGHKILFDVGPDNTLFENSETLGINLLDIDTVILSHGHMDHGGALESFLKLNRNAKVYAQRNAFNRHYAKRFLFKRDIGIPKSLEHHPRMVLLDGDHLINDELILFTTPGIYKYRSTANNMLYSGSGKDDFSHEQNLIIRSDSTVLIIGCGHAGIVNVLERAMEYNPKVCVGGYHLWNPSSTKTVPDKLLDDISRELTKLDIKFYTCHCTGRKAYEYFTDRLPNMSYLFCGKTIEI